MRKILVLFAVIGLLLQSVSAFQTKAVNYAGDWTLDKSKSELPRMMQGIESMTMKVTQTEKELTTETTTTGGQRGGGTQKATYSLDGKETTGEVGGRFGGTATYKAKVEKDGKVSLSSERKVSGPMGEFTLKTTETWELTDDGKTLKISRTNDTPNGAMSSTLYFTKK
jgi:hypothetical protein